MGKGIFQKCFRSMLISLAAASATGNSSLASVASQSFVACVAQNGLSAAGAAGGRMIDKIGSAFKFPTRQKFNKVPTAETVDGRTITGAYGSRTKRTKGDFMEINREIGEIRRETARRRNEIYDDYERGTDPVMGSRPKLEQSLNNRIKNHENELINLREQYELYGPNSVQGRIIDQRIKSEVHLLNENKRLLGDLNDYYSAGGANRGRQAYGDYGYVPAGGEFGRRMPKGKMSAQERADMQYYRDRWKIERSDAYDTIKMANSPAYGKDKVKDSLDREYKIFSEKVEHNYQQRENYRGTEWKRTLDYEILRDLKVLNAQNKIDADKYPWNPNWDTYLPKHLRNEIY